MKRTRHLNPSPVSTSFMFRLHRQTHRLMRFVTVFLLSGTLMFSFAAHAENDKKDKKEKPDKVKFKILQNSEFNDCKYVGDVIIKVKYRLKSYDEAQLVAELSRDGVNYYDAAKIDVERSGEKTIMEFDAGECATDLRVVIR